MNMNKKLIYYCFEVLSLLSFIVSSVFLAYFVRDIWNDYKSGKTNDRIYSETREYYEHPTITICFEPELNTLKLQKYNITSIEDLYLGINQNIPVISLVHNLRYKIGRDFIIIWRYYDVNETYTIHKIQTPDHLQGKYNSGL